MELNEFVIQNIIPLMTLAALIGGLLWQTKSHNGRFDKLDEKDDTHDKSLSNHDKRIAINETKLEAHDGEFSKIDDKMGRIDKKLDTIRDFVVKRHQ